MPSKSATLTISLPITYTLAMSFAVYAVIVMASAYLLILLPSHYSSLRPFDWFLLAIDAVVLVIMTATLPRLPIVTTVYKNRLTTTNIFGVRKQLQLSHLTLAENCKLFPFIGLHAFVPLNLWGIRLKDASGNTVYVYTGTGPHRYDMALSGVLKQYPLTKDLATQKYVRN